MGCSGFSISGIVVLVLGKYRVFGYMDPAATHALRVWTRGLWLAAGRTYELQSMLLRMDIGFYTSCFLYGPWQV